MNETDSSGIAVVRSESTRIGDVDFETLDFGGVFSDHMLVCHFEKGQWKPPTIVPYRPITLDPAAKIFHYGQSVFEGMKAYRDESDIIWLFRPLENFERLNRSSKRLAIPELPESYFMNGLKALLELDKLWIPNKEGHSLYIRPFVFASGKGLHASPSDEYTFVIITSPSGSYFAGEVNVIIEEQYARSANGGVGCAKAGGNYAAQFYPTQLAIEKGYQQIIWTDATSHTYIEEAGSMNIFFRIDDTLVTTPISDRILDGVTRKSIITLAKANNIKVEVRNIAVDELIVTAKNGRLKELFGAGTGVVVSPIASFSYQNKRYMLPKLGEASYARRLKQSLTNIQTNRAKDPFGWRYKV